MSHTYSSNRVHVIFSTKERRKYLSDDFQPKLWAYMAGIAHNQGFETMIIGGVSDHIHVLLALPPALALAKAIQLLKGVPPIGSISLGPAKSALPGRKAMAPSA